jgi:hypothetical protein
MYRAEPHSAKTIRFVATVIIVPFVFFLGGKLLYLAACK